MEWKVAKESLTSLATDCLVVVHTQGGEALKGCIQQVDEALEHRISRLVTEGEVTGKLNETTFIHQLGEDPCQASIGFGVGEKRRAYP